MRADLTYAGVLAHGEDTPLKKSLASDFAKWDTMVSFVNVRFRVLTLSTT